MKFRQVNLDFHTSEKIHNIGVNFNKIKFQEALKRGHIDSVTLFSKCHHGWAYHPSNANQIHPHLNFDLLGAQIEAAHEIGVKTPVYISAGFDEKIALVHPEWLVRNKNESTIWTPDFTEAGYHKFCMNSPYLDYLISQIEEVCRNYDADGIFLDIVCVQPCYCHNCIQERLAKGVDPYDWNEVVSSAEEVYARYANAARDAVNRYKPGLPIFHNGGHIRQGRRDLIDYNTHLELESLPTGGWGYDHFVFSARYCQTLGIEYLGMTGKFHKSWGEFGGFKHPNALRYEVSLSIANGAKCSIGDQLSPNGMSDMTTYDLIGKAYEELERKEPWLDNVTSVADIAVLSSEAYTGSFGTHQSTTVGTIDSGVVRILLEGKFLFDIIDMQSDLQKYKVVILPDIIKINKAFKNKLAAFCKNGGKILATGESCIDTDNNNFAFDLGAEFISPNCYKPDYFRPVAAIEGMSDTSYIMYEDGIKIECTGDLIANREDPYFNRERNHFCSHMHAPSSGKSGGAGMTYGKNGIYVAWKIFQDYATSGSLHLKHIIVYALNMLLESQKTITTNLPAQGIVTLMRQNSRYINHLLYASPVKRGNGIEVIEDIVPIYDVRVRVKIPEKVKKIYLAPQMEDVQFKQNGTTVEYCLHKLECHQMVVLDI